MSKIVQQQGYEPLQLDSEHSSDPRRLRKHQLLALSVIVGLAVLIAIVTVLTAVYSHQKHSLEVLPDNSPASKRGAGLLLT